MSRNPHHLVLAKTSTLLALLIVFFGFSSVLAVTDEDLQEAAEEEILEEIEEIEPSPIDLSFEKVSGKLGKVNNGNKKGLNLVFSIKNASEEKQSFVLEATCNNNSFEAIDVKNFTPGLGETKLFLPLSQKEIRNLRKTKLDCEAQLTLTIEDEPLEDDDESNNRLVFTVSQKKGKLQFEILELK